MNEYKRLTYWQDDKDGDGNNIRYACVDGTKYALCDVLNRLAELEDKIENGTLVELPCKVGDRVYQTDGIRIYESTIKNIIYDTDSIAFDDRAIGNSIFLTREEAEKALAERNIE